MDRDTSFKLVPDDGDLKTTFARLALQPREATTTYPYRVEADAVSFPDDPGNGSPGDLRIRANADGTVPARFRQLYVDDVHFIPEPALGGQTSTFSANVVSFFYDDPEIEWSYTLVGPDPDDPENSVITYQTRDSGGWQDFNQDFQLSLPWDGKSPTGQTAPAGTYDASLTVYVREKSDQSFLALAERLTSLQVLSPKSIGVTLTANPPGLTTAASQPVLLAAHADLQGFEGTPEVRWAIQVQDPRGEEVFSALGQGNDYQTEWSNGPLAEGVYTITARADAENVHGQSSIDFPVGGANQKSVKIEHASVSPQPFVPGQGALSIAAQASLQGGAVGYDYFTWKVEIFDPNNERVFAQGPFSAGDLMAVQWDGRRAQGHQLVEPGSYTVKIQVTSCEDLVASTEPGTPNCVTANASLVAQAGLPRLSVFSLPAGKELGFDPPDPTKLVQPSELMQRRALLKNIYPLGQQGVSDQWLLLAETLTFSSPPADGKVHVTVKSALSGKSKPVALEPGPGPGGTTVYRLQVSCSDLIDSNLGAGGTTFTTSTMAFHETISDAFDAFMSASPFGFPSPVVKLGNVDERFYDDVLAEQRQDASTHPKNPTDKAAPRDDQAQNTPANFRCTGFEAVTVTLEASNNPGLLLPAGISKLEAVVKVRHPARVMLVNHHGGHDGNLALTQEARVLFPTIPDDKIEPLRNFRVDDARQIETLLLSACEALDLHDYNNILAVAQGPPFPAPPEHRPEDPIAYRLTYGGDLWLGATEALVPNRATRVALLGYNGPAPSHPQALVLAEYASELQRFEAQRTTGQLDPLVAQDMRQIAWVTANLRVATGKRLAPVTASPQDLQNADLCIHACAYSPDNYYYIAFDGTATRDRLKPNIRKRRGVHRVPVGAWNTDCKDWMLVPSDTAIYVDLKGLTPP